MERLSTAKIRKKSVIGPYLQSMKNRPPLTALTALAALTGVLILALSATKAHAQKIFAEQRVIIIMMDGFADTYYRAASMPFLNQMEKQGIYKVVPSLMPAVT